MKTEIVHDCATGETFEREMAEPVVSVPDAISMRQARLALLQADLLSAVDAAVDSLDTAARIEWEYATEVRRDSVLVAMLAPALGLDDKQVDALFIAAAAL